MKNPTILKDELGLLNADKSAVMIELRGASEKLKETFNEINEAESKLDEVRTEITETTARLDELRSRAVSVKAELATVKQDLQNTQNSYESSKVKNSQEIKLHLGRIKELEEEEQATLNEIAKLKALYDKNSDAYAQHTSDKQTYLRALSKDIKLSESELSKLTTSITKNREEDKKMTKERLKREDKIRVREKNLESREKSMEKKEEDIVTMVKDMTIIYGRLKELYYNIDPTVDLDRLVIQIK
jgi:chromosome segregation ATPase